MKGSEGTGNSRVLIRVGDVEIDISGSQKEVDAEMMNIRDGEQWSTAIAKVRTARETAIAAAVEAAKKSGKTFPPVIKTYDQYKLKR